jgi:hypothetical protein
LIINWAEKCINSIISSSLYFFTPLLHFSIPDSSGLHTPRSLLYRNTINNLRWFMWLEQECAWYLSLCLRNHWKGKMFLIKKSTRFTSSCEKTSPFPKKVKKPLHAEWRRYSICPIRYIFALSWGSFSLSNNFSHQCLSRKSLLYVPLDCRHFNCHFFRLWNRIFSVRSLRLICIIRLNICLIMIFQI